MQKMTNSALAVALNSLLAVVMFVAFFLIGFIYVRKKGALEWEK